MTFENSSQHRARPDGELQFLPLQQAEADNLPSKSRKVMVERYQAARIFAGLRRQPIEKRMLTIVEQADSACRLESNLPSTDAGLLNPCIPAVIHL